MPDESATRIALIGPEMVQRGNELPAGVVARQLLLGPRGEGRGRSAGRQAAISAQGVAVHLVTEEERAVLAAAGEEQGLTIEGGDESTVVLED